MKIPHLCNTFHAVLCVKRFAIDLTEALSHRYSFICSISHIQNHLFALHVTEHGSDHDAQI